VGGGQQEEGKEAGVQVEREGWREEMMWTPVRERVMRTPAMKRRKGSRLKGGRRRRGMGC
jgi:hypothetical protein